MKASVCMIAAAASLGLASFALAGEITGKITLDGKAPEAKVIDMSAVKECNEQHPDPVTEETIVADDKGDLKNVVVSIKKEDSPDLTGEAPKDAVTLDQHGCMYSPHVIACMTGQKFVIKNDDPFLHNVHALSQVNPSFNFGQSNKGEKPVDPMKAAEYFHVKCDVHPWMSAYVAVFDHPFFAVSGDDGTFAIKNLPDGDYTVLIWHEKLATTPIEQKVSVKDGKGTLEYTMKQESAQAAPAPASVVKEITLASAKTK